MLTSASVTKRLCACGCGGLTSGKINPNLQRPVRFIKGHHGAQDERERFWSRVDKTDGCWVWTGPLHRGGYAKFQARDGRKVFVHRFSYETLVGPIPEGLFIDHLCENRLCVKPDHLEPVTHRENNLRSIRRGRRRRSPR
jgi:hypothetical protein